jgi:IS5 family transposase
MEKNYARVKELGDKLAEIDPLIDWEVFRPIIREMYDIIHNVAVDLIMMK